MKMYDMIRHEDESGVSGTGRVAEVVEFSNGKCVVSWNRVVPSLVVYDTFEQVKKIHGHDGKTTFELVCRLHGNKSDESKEV